ncbi:hypothetical protein OPV22_011337 [Ensete ventricosum]|uniref:DUF4228 domain-containing protein n=1 Tax=Ensete ventricosum TaxID=4639 RepID=A0AAV8PX23_ENSVE|nr:hypothetical protein OPV22_011337 [Ensete ventricosum]
MGNCQVTDAAAVVIQHPGGRAERLYWPTSASEVMKNNPGHYVALITLYVPEEKQDGTLRLTRVRLLKATDTLLLGQVYRLITSQEVMKAIQARKIEKMKKRQAEVMERQQQQRIGIDDEVVQVGKDGEDKEDSEITDQVAKQERDRHKTTSKQSAARPRHWRPSLPSIAETGS